MSKTTYDINIRQDDAWFMIEIPELGGLTQARTLDEAPDMAREWIALTTGVDSGDVAVRIVDSI